MATVAPNLSTLIGETVAARLIQKAGSLTSLAKCPASTVQILGAEKALFRWDGICVLYFVYPFYLKLIYLEEIIGSALMIMIIIILFYFATVVHDAWLPLSLLSSHRSFRALKTKGNTPKYGLIYHSSFIGRASAKNKGRISRYLANKCAIASRIDSFIEEPTKAYGEQLRDQVRNIFMYFEISFYIIR